MTNDTHSPGITRVNAVLSAIGDFTLPLESGRRRDVPQAGRQAPYLVEIFLYVQNLRVREASASRTLYCRYYSSLFFLTSSQIITNPVHKIIT